MLYMGTEEAKILSCPLNDLFSCHVNRGLASIQVSSLDEEELRRILQENEAQLQNILNDYK